MSQNAGQYKTSYQVEIGNTTSTDVEGIGCLRLKNGKKYKWVKHTLTNAITVVEGDAVGYLPADTGLTTISSDVSECITGLLAGIATATMADGYYGWIQIGGPSGILTVAPTGSTPAIGDAANLSSTDKAVKKTPLATEQVCGYLTNVTGSAETLYLTCPE